MGECARESQLTLSQIVTGTQIYNSNVKSVMERNEMISIH